MNKKNYKLIWIILIGLIVGWAGYLTLGKKILTDAYHGQSLEQVNRIFSGQTQNSLDDYLQLANGILGKFSVYALIFCMFYLLPRQWKFSVFSVILLFILIEGALRVYDFYLDRRFPENIEGEAILWEYDPLLGWAQKPNASARFVSKKNRINTLCKINSRGLRDEEYAYEKESGVERILLLGDSVVEGFEVDKKDALDAKLEEQLQANGNYQVINGGTRGYGTDQAFLFLKNEGYKYSPDIIIYVFVPNDLENNITIHKPGRKFGKGYFTKDPQGKINLKGIPVPESFEQFDEWMMTDPYAQEYYNSIIKRNKTFEKKLVKQRDIATLIRKDFAKFHFVKWIYKRVQMNKKLEKIFVQLNLMDPSLQMGWELDVPKSVTNVQWESLKNILAEMARYIDYKNVKFLVYEFTAMGDESQPTKLNQVCNTLNIPYFNNFDDYAEKAKGKPIFRYPFDGHWNERGHALAAEGIYHYLKRKQWVN
ncbi:MAG: hypothetical protein H6755_06265 [Candidatus Omnitrophica bacterium]|nr:hypothetical protein [Candidatus Omnitrophota bacterium]MCB9747995.1 hypothetical protein [Candidatus Omnitrophota bacterium]